MLNVLAVPVLAFLMGISGIPGLNALPGLKGLGRHKPKPVAADSLPPLWKPAPRLALERNFVRRGLPAFGQGPSGIKLGANYDPRKLRTRIDPDSGAWSVAVEVGDIRLGEAYRAPLAQFASLNMRQSFVQRWQERSRRDLNSLGAGATPAARQGLQLALPVQLPSFATSILGPGGPALNVSGSESIRLSGQSNWTNQQTTVLGQKRSLFPSLDMQQDLDIRLEGQLSDRVKVNLLQNSANQIPLANRIAINYRGDEDDLVQALDLGNTSLALPGTQYVSYSGRNEGLFGVKVATRFGPLDFTALASKQEGRSERASYSGGGATRSTQTIADVDWIKGQYFLLYDPQFGAWKIDDTDISIYRDDRINSNDTNPLRGKAMVDPTGFMMGTTLSGTPSDTAGYRGNFDRLTPAVDYEILPDYYLFTGGVSFKIIRLKQPMPTTSNMCLAASYRATPVNLETGAAIGEALVVGGTVLGASAGADSGYTELKMLRSPRELLAPANPGDLNRTSFDTTAAFDPVRELEMKNFYALGGYGIDPKSFTLTVQKGRSEPPVLYADGPDNARVNFIEVLGLDGWDESNSTPVKGHDEKVDGTGRSSGTRAFVDYTNGVLWIPDPRPFAPRVNGGNGQLFDEIMDLPSNANRRVRFDGQEGASNEANSGIYDKYKLEPATDAEYYFVAEISAQRSGGNISLQRGSLLEGSEVVTVNGERWTRDRDYRIDYDTGQITLLRGLGPTDQLSIDYSYAPLFQQAGKTLIGSAFRLEGRDRSLGGAFLYESKGAQDQRPRLGEEPSRTLITDLNSEWRFRPSFLTRMVDAIPGVRTSAPSEFNVQAEVGASFPNPNTRNEVFVDDMEGVRDAVSLSMTADRWHPMSVPTRARVVDASGRAIVTDDFLDLPGQRNGELHWYMPPNYVHERDLKPTLTDAQGAKNPRQALALSVPRVPEAMRNDPGLLDSLWAGLTYVLDPQGIDLSRAQFIELWVNDFRDRHDPALPRPIVRANDNRVLLHIDLGVVSEDQMRAPNRLPDGVLNTEDTPPRDNQLVADKEDTGIDGRRNATEETPIADLLTASASDPEGDDYRDPDDEKEDIDPRKFLYTNGTENNYRLAPYPDTEDLNANDNIDRAEHYFEYTIPLADSSQRYLMTDVHRDFSSQTSVSDDNGWRRYRIPISDSLRIQFGSPDLTLARHVRIWIEGLEEAEPKTASVQRPLLLLGGVEIVGNRWLAVELSEDQQRRQTTMTLNSVNSLDDADIYVPPFDPGETRNGNQALTRREQSIALEFTNLGPDTLEAYRSFSLEENYTRYGALRWYASGYDVNGYDATTDTTLFYFVRFASDERGKNYYEIKRRMPRSSTARAIDWQETRVLLEEVSNFKLGQSTVITEPLRMPYGTTGDSVIIVGRPSFTRLRRVSFGVINSNPSGGRVYPSGRLWFDEVRATDVKKDVGYANRLLVNGRMANLLSYNVSWNSRDENFLQVGESRGSGNSSTQLQATSQFDVHRFFEGTGITLPVSVAYNRNSSKPRFSAGDDVVRTGEQQAASETRSETRSVSTSYTRAWGERTHPLLKYTVAGLTANISRSETDSRSPSAVSSSVATNAGVNWGVSPRVLLPVSLPLSKAKLYPLPERVYWNYQVSSSKSEQFTRATDGSGDLVPSSNLKGRQASLGFGADTRPVDMITHHIEGQRALSLDNVPLDRIGFVNFGRLTSWRQNFTSRYSLQRGAWMRPSMSWGSNFGQQNDITSPNLSIRSITNGQNVQVNWDLPFDGLLNRRPAPAPVAVRPDTAGGKPAPPKRPAIGWRDVFARVGNVQTDLQLTRSSSYSRLRGTPGFLYLVGLAEDPGFADSTSGVSAAPGNNSQTGLDWRTNARTRVPVMYGSQLMLRFSFGDRTGENNGVLSRTSDVRFPDVEVDYGRVANAIKLTSFLQNPSIRTAWSVSKTFDYQVRRDSLTGESRTSDFHPLLALRGSFKNGIQADLGVNRRSTERLVHQYGTSSQVENNSDVNFTLSRSYSQGQKVTFLGKTSTVRSSVSLQLATVYSHTKGETRYANNAGAAQKRDETRLSVTSTGSYGFSSNVTGSAVLGFNYNNNAVQNIQRKSIRVEVRAQFSF